MPQGEPELAPDRPMSYLQTCLVADVVKKGCSTMPIKGQSGQTVRLPWAHLRIPPFPQIAIRILQLTNNEDVSMSQVSALISSEPAFSSEVLTIANSALYSVPFSRHQRASGSRRAWHQTPQRPVSYCRSESLPWRVAQQ